MALPTALILTVLSVSNLPRTDNRVLRLNVGFLLKESAGFTRDFAFEHTTLLHVEDVIVNRLDGKLRLTRTRQGIVVHGTLHAWSPAECVRCLDTFELNYPIEISDLFIYPAPLGTDNPFIVDEGGFIDLSPVVREEGILAVPMHALCSSDCKGLCPQCGQNWNESACDCHTETGDPRLSVLRELLLNE